ncbi:Hypothetical protein CAP_3174 [Chondromyces apiculatus DSM 436]|uniref:Uncharacterized protein n=1 Tax=Chondromyces apiculatus DSM 436 TaxID=1192034 RepID=A0A017TAK5_9BACT|nr:Hypothetical protein CAP_3174 [Chondromyces apiculatus DSM 436]
MAPAVAPDDILVLRRGPGANCSSVGSAVDVLFLSAVVAGAALVAVAAAVRPRRAAHREAEEEAGAGSSGSTRAPVEAGEGAQERQAKQRRSEGHGGDDADAG